MRNPLLVALVGLLAAALVLPGALSAQASGNITATANVLTPLSVVGAQNLIFDDVIPGFGTSVAPGGTGSGQFTVGGSGTLEVELTFTGLPANLTSGANTLPITFAADDAGFGATPAAVDQTFDPAAGATTNLVSGVLAVFIGGTVTAAPAQPSGSYTGTITLDVAYTGN